VAGRSGDFDPIAMRRALITPDDLQEDMKLELKAEDKSRIGVARLESNGDITARSDYVS
jgi:uncharacterized membrane protein YcaP (DUF421 family)